MTLAPASLAALMVGREARMRASLETAPFLTGTLRSSRIRTRLPARFRSVIFLMAMIWVPLIQLIGKEFRYATANFGLHPACGWQIPIRYQTSTVLSPWYPG